ncbi:MAG TPA: LLM class flavin-dependent oxidoreductase [Acidimicrobiales bacterium]|nr:LLM class flavin-dependent oxidoreductase [Acidimicrobiales bacterium]
MNVGLVAPVFQRSPDLALRVAQLAEESGIDGVFSYDHLFPMNSPGRPALAAIPVLAAMAMRTARVRLGTLVSRVTVLPLPVLVDALVTLDELSGHRAIAGLGTGDRLTEAENRAYGMDFPNVAARLELLIEAARGLRQRGVETWIGGRSRAVREVAAAEADAWNSWAGPTEELAAFAAANRPGGAGHQVLATWGGPPPADANLEAHLVSLAGAGVAWAIYGPAPDIDWTSFVAKLADAAKAVR